MLGVEIPSPQSIEAVKSDALIFGAESVNVARTASTNARFTTALTGLVVKFCGPLAVEPETVAVVLEVAFVLPGPVTSSETLRDPPFA